MRARAWIGVLVSGLLLAAGLVAPAVAAAEPAAATSGRSPGVFGKSTVIARVPVSADFEPATGRTVVLRAVSRWVSAKGDARRVLVEVDGRWRRVPYRFDRATYTLVYDEGLRRQLGGDPLGGVRARTVVRAQPQPSPSASQMSDQESADDPRVVASLGSGWREAGVGTVNAVRSAAGAPSLRLCPALSRAAQAWANHLAATGAFAHTEGDGTIWDRLSAAGYASNLRLHGEVLALGSSTIAGSMQQWVESPSHYDVFITPQFTDYGIGAATTASGQLVWAMDLSFGGDCG